MAGNKHFRRVALGTLQPKVGPDFFKGFSRHRVLLCRDAKMNMRTFVKLGFVALTMGASFGGGFPVEADQLVWARARQLDVWRVRWLMRLELISITTTKSLLALQSTNSDRVLGNRDKLSPSSGKRTRIRQPI